MSYRLKKENILFSAIIPGPLKPADIFSFLYPTIQELLQLESHGITLSSNNVSYKASLAMVIGDIPGLADLCFHTGHMSYTGCRVCKVKGTDKSIANAIYFPSFDTETNRIHFCPLRTIEDFRTANDVRILKKYT